MPRREDLINPVILGNDMPFIVDEFGYKNLLLLNFLAHAIKTHTVICENFCKIYEAQLIMNMLKKESKKVR